MKNVTGLANQQNLVGVKSCKLWGWKRLNATRLEMNNGRVQWTIHAHLLGRSFSIGTAKGGR